MNNLWYKKNTLSIYKSYDQIIKSWNKLKINPWKRIRKSLIRTNPSRTEQLLSARGTNKNIIPVQKYFYQQFIYNMLTK